MSTLLTSLPQLVFPHELSRLEIAPREGQKSGVLAVSLDGESLYPFSLTASASTGAAVLEGADALLTERLEGEDIRLHTLALTDELGAALYEGELLPCRWRLSQGGEAFCRTRFLSSCSRTRLWPLTGREEEQSLTLAFFSEGQGEDFTVSSLWWNPVSLRVGRREDTETVSAYGLHLRRIDFQALPRPTEASGGAGWRLLRVTASCGERVQVFETAACPRTEAAAPELLRFRGAWGQDDAVWLFGPAEREAKASYTAAACCGEYLSLAPQLAPSWKMQSGPLPEDCVPLMEDLARSSKVWSWRYGQLTPTAFELSDKGLSTSLPSAAVTLRQRSTAALPSFAGGDALAAPARPWDASFAGEFG